MLAPASGIVTLDLHGRNVYQARVAIDAALKRQGPAVYRIRLIHGHSRGTALRDMIGETYAAHPRVLRLCRIGEDATDLVLREL